MLETLRTATALSVVGVLVFWVLFDLVAFVLGGSEATVSRVFWEASEQYRWLAVAVSFILGTLVGHLFLPQHV